MYKSVFVSFIKPHRALIPQRWIAISPNSKSHHVQKQIVRPAFSIKTQEASCVISLCKKQHILALAISHLMHFPYAYTVCVLGETSLDDNQRSRKKWRQMLVKSKNTAVDMLKTQTDSLLKSKWKKKLLTTGCILVSSFISYLSYKCPCNIKCSHTEVVTVC